MAGESVRHSPSAEAEPLFSPHQRVLWPQEGPRAPEREQKGPPCPEVAGRLPLSFRVSWWTLVEPAANQMAPASCPPDTGPQPGRRSEPLSAEAPWCGGGVLLLCTWPSHR